MERHGTGRPFGIYPTSAYRLLDEPVDMRTNDPTGRCATFATCRQLQFVIPPVVTAVCRCSGVLGPFNLSFAVYIRSSFVIYGVNRQDYLTTSREILTNISICLYSTSCTGMCCLVVLHSGKWGLGWIISKK